MGLAELQEQINQLTNKNDVIEIFYQTSETLMDKIETKLKDLNITKINVSAYRTQLLLARKVNAQVPINHFVESVYLPHREYVLGNDLDHFKAIDVSSSNANQEIKNDAMFITSVIKSLPDKDVMFVFYYVSILIFAIDRYFMLSK